MERQSIVTTGTVAFSCLTQTDTYMGQDTGKFNLKLVLDEAEAAKLADLGVKVGEYEGNAQRKFSSKYPVTIVDNDDNPFPNREIPRGSAVKVLWKTGPAHPVHGTATYMERIRVVEEAERAEDNIPAEF